MKRVVKAGEVCVWSDETLCHGGVMMDGEVINRTVKGEETVIGWIMMVKVMTYRVIKIGL